ncbi:MAG: hypothetical protein HQL16_07565 [Candidatus Omnitrophica bacterium]|nr:hypothetical protein [Candidatus Omnitrophota bacterium]
MTSVVKEKKTKEVERKAAVIKKSVAGLGRHVSRRAERVADIILDEGKELKGQKTQKITDETVSMFKDVRNQFRADLKGVKARDFLAVGAYSAGRASAVVMRGINALLG